METKKCTYDNCGWPTSGKSKYCAKHKAEANRAFHEMLLKQGEEKAARELSFEELWNRASAAGREAASFARPKIVSIAGYNPFPICGFAWVTIRPANSQFANWLKKNGHARKAYGGGVEIWISDYNQSCDLKYAHANAMAQVFRAAGINASAGNRLD